MLLTDYHGKMFNLLEQLEIVLKPYALENDIIAREMQEIRDVYKNKLAVTKPEIMVYGIYNAGKSSIINELLGKDEAKVEDVPTTYKIDYYEWNGYRVADTPGVDAPHEHEEVTQEHLKRSDVVIFVMSTTGANERRSNYERMKDIVGSGKKLIIVLNDKNGELYVDDMKIQEIKHKVVTNMNAVGINNQYTIIAVNAMRAKAGRIKKDSRLTDKSGIAELGDIIMQELKKTNSFGILARAVGEIEKNIKNIINLLLKVDNSFEMQVVQNLLTDLHERREHIQQDMKSCIKRETQYRIAKELPEMIWRSQGEPAVQTQGAVQKIYEEVSTTVQEKLEYEVQQMMKEFSKEFEISYDKLKNIKACRIDGNIHSVRMDEVTQDMEKKTGKVSDAMETVMALLANKVVMDGGKTLLKDLAKNTIVQGALKTVAVQTILKSSVGKVIGSFVPVIGPVIAWLPVLINILGGNTDMSAEQHRIAEQNDYNRKVAEAKLEAQQELCQKCRYSAEKLADVLMMAVGESLTVIEAELCEPFNKQKDGLQGDKDNLAKVLSTLRDIGIHYQEMQDMLFKMESV